MDRRSTPLPASARQLALAAAAVVAAAACDPLEGSQVLDGRVPSVPRLAPGRATLGGRVISMDGLGVPGAQVTVIETGALATTEADGAFRLGIPADSTLTLRVTAGGHAPSRTEPVLVAADSSVSDLDVLLLPAAKLAEYNQMAGRPGVAAGVLAVRVRALSPGCTADGAVLRLAPETLGTVLYARGGGPATDPDRTLAAMSSSAGIAAWVVGVPPPGNQLSLIVAKPGCASPPAPVAVAERTYPGRFDVEAGGLAHATLFLR